MSKPELISSLNVLSKRIDSLVQTQRKLQDRIIQLENSNLELMKQHESDQLALKAAQKDIEYLSLSHRLADSPEALVKARAEIARLIRTIDSCIRLIIED